MPFRKRAHHIASCGTRIRVLKVNFIAFLLHKVTHVKIREVLRNAVVTSIPFRDLTATGS